MLTIENEQRKMDAYEVVVEKADDGYVAYYAELGKGLTATRETRKDAIAALELFGQDIAEMAAEEGEPLPKAGERLDRPASGKFTVRVRSDLHSQIQREAQLENVSFNSMVVSLLEKGFQLVAMDRMRHTAWQVKQQDSLSEARWDRFAKQHMFLSSTLLESTEKKLEGYPIRR